MRFGVKNKKNLAANLLSCLLWIAALIIAALCYSKLKTYQAYSYYNGANSYIVSSMRNCAGQKNLLPCFEKAAADFMSKYPLKVTLAVFAKNQQDPPFFTYCHQTAHFLGRDEYKLLKSVPLALAAADDTCLGGTYHGIMEGYFMEHHYIYGDPATDKIIAQQVATICGKINDYTVPEQFYNCNHGLGHALMYATSNDLVQSLKLCDNIPIQGDQELCYTGALMENATDANSITDPSKYYKANDPTYPCNILDQRYQKICYTYGVLSLYQNNIPKAIQLCSTIPQQFSDDCFQTFGRDRTMISDDPANLYSQCGQVKDESYRTECLKGLSYNLVVRFGLQSPLAAEFCALVDQQNKPTCYVRIEEGAEAETRDESKLMSFCNTITESSYKDSCKQYFQPPQQ